MSTKRKDLIAYIRAGDLAGAKELLRSNPEAARFSGAVVEAGQLGSQKALALLLRHGADLNASWRGYRALHGLIQEKPHASLEGVEASRVACLKWMLEKGADPEELAAFPPTRAVVTAAFVGETAYVDELLRAGAVVDGFVAAALADVRRVEKILAKETGFATARDPGGLTALHCCAGSRLGKRSKKAREGQLAIAGMLLDRGADPNARVRGWARELDVSNFAIAPGQRELFELLLDCGADATAALPSAVWRCDFESAELALSHGARLDHAVDEGKPLLNQMIRWGQIRQALWLLERGASPNITDAQGWTAAHQAASRGNERMMKAVIAGGADTSRKDKEGKTPLDIARSKGRSKLVALLS